MAYFFEDYMLKINKRQENEYESLHLSKGLSAPLK